MACGPVLLLPCRPHSAPRTEIPETTPVGTVLKTFTCTDPDSAGSPLDYELQFHSPPGPASLCLRGRALEVPSPAYRPMCWVLQDMKVEGWGGGKVLWELRP